MLRALKFVATALALVTASAPQAQRPARAQQVIRVVDSATRAPIAGVDVADVATGNRALTKADGSVALVLENFDSASVLARKIGYAPRHVRFAIADSAVPIHLQRLTTLPAATVSAEGVSAENVQKLRMVGFLQRRQTSAASASSFITDVDIARMKPFLVSDITARFPSRGGCTTYLDGVRLQPSGGRGFRQGIDQLMMPSEIAAVEVYRGAAVVPPQFAAIGRANCVVLYWLK